MLIRARQITEALPELDDDRPSQVAINGFDFRAATHPCFGRAGRRLGRSILAYRYVCTCFSQVNAMGYVSPMVLPTRKVSAGLVEKGFLDLYLHAVAKLSVGDRIFWFCRGLDLQRRNEIGNWFSLKCCYHVEDLRQRFPSCRFLF